jgi:hypothetical protein
MPIEFDLWRIDGQTTRLSPVRLVDESRLERILADDARFLGIDVMIIGRQVITAFGKRIDLLAIDGQGNLCVIEIKRDRTPREVVAQLLDYAAWITSLTYENIVSIYQGYTKGGRFEQAFAERFGVDEPPEALNQSHRLIVVASELDNSTERIVTYLSNGYGVPINAVFFRYIRDDMREYLARTWLIDPGRAEIASGNSGTAKGHQEPWNGQDYYVAIGEGENRSWEDCAKYGFVSAGHGRRYSRALENLLPGARVFACIPQRGYVGVGIVDEPSQPVKDFLVSVDCDNVPILQAPLVATGMADDAEDSELSEYLVRVKWLKTLAREQAFWEKGMFANQNVVAKLRRKFTLDRLVHRFDLAQ